jgi:hypothetical protein
MPFTFAFYAGEGTYNQINQNLNFFPMSDSMLKQFLYEIKAWKRSLAYMQEDGIHLKYRLSEVVNDVGEGHRLEMAEDFHNSFIAEDDLIKVLREEVDEQDELLHKDLPAAEGSSLPKGMINNQARIRKDMARAELFFHKVKANFDAYLSNAFAD